MYIIYYPLFLFNDYTSLKKFTYKGELKYSYCKLELENARLDLSSYKYFVSQAEKPLTRAPFDLLTPPILVHV